MKISIHPWLRRNKRKWVLSRGRGKDRKCTFFNTKAEAQAAAETLRLDISQACQEWIQLSPSDRQRLILAYHEAARAGITLDAIVTQAKAAPSGPAASPPLSAVMTELLAAKSAAGRAPAYTANLRAILNDFAQGKESTPIASIHLPDIQSFLDSKELASRSTLRSRLSTCFKFAVRRGYRQDNPCACLEPITVIKPPPAVFTPHQVQSCLAFLSTDHHLTRPVNCTAGARRGSCAYSIAYTQTFRDILPWFVLSTFCGLRPEEAEKTRPADIHATEGWVRVEAQTSKVGQRRVVYPRPEAMRLLLRSLHVGGELPLHPQRRKRALKALRAHLGIKAWPKDITRHSAASYWLAIGETAANVADSLGHSERILKRNYKALVTRADAQTFWKTVATFKPTAPSPHAGSTAP